MKKITNTAAMMIIICLLSSCSQAQKTSVDTQHATANEKILIVYLSRTNNTKAIAEIIQNNVGGDLVAIELRNPYPADYKENVEQVSKENETGYLPPLKTKIDSIEKYDVIFVGFPTWGMKIPPPMKTFLKQYDLSGKTIIPFNTNAGYGVGSSFQTIKELCPNSTILEGFIMEGGKEKEGKLLVIQGKKRNEAETEVKKWLEKINIVTASKKKNTAINSIGMEFINIPAGSFLMGANDVKAYASKKPQHKVTISKSFYIAKHEVTQAQWEAVMGSNPYTLDRSNPYCNLPGMKERITQPEHPATVSWNDLQAFIKKLNEKEGRNHYRLPTEAEWEYATRAGTTTAYSFGDNSNKLSSYAWHGEDFASGGTHPIGQKLPNAWGLFDVHGNVWEWVQDKYSDTYYAQSPDSDPNGPANGNQYVVRGGSWHETATSWRSSFRKAYEADYRGISIGFRLVKTAD
jgi:formylglycine-generating enzyme required for sulfatase activity